MRQFTESVQSELNKKHGLETILYIGVKWAGDNEVYYSSNEVSGATKSLLNISGMETASRVDGNGSSQSVQVTLSDTDGKLTEILNTVDIHKRPANVYMGFPGVPLDQALTLISGQINSPIEWDEAARTVSFTILSSVEGRVFGFSVEDGQFGEVDQSQRTAPWPFRFGYTCAEAAVKIGVGVKGFLRSPQGVVDPTLDLRLCQADKINCPAILSKNIDGSYGSGGPTNIATLEQYGGPPPGTRFDGPNPGLNPVQRYFVGLLCDGDTTVTKITAIPDLGFGSISGFEEYDPEVHGYQFLRGKCIADYSDEDRNCERTKRDLQCQLLQQKSDQEFWAKPTMTVAGGDDFPQNTPVTILVGTVLYEGSFSGETFTITKVNSYDPTSNPNCEDIPEYRRGYRLAENENPTTAAECNTTSTEPELRLVGGAGEAFRRMEEFEGAGFIWLPSGTDVTLQSSSTEVHIVSLTPGVVLQVSAYRTVGDLKLLTQLPTDYYEVVTVDYGDLSAVEVHLTRPLSSYADERWDSTIYTTFQSSVDANPVDVIEWIAGQYTDLTIDATTFSVAKARTGKYPCNYYYAEKRDVFSVISQIAYEARCALSISDGVLKIVYLPYEPSSLRTLTDGDVVSKSFSYNLTQTEQLVTSSEVTWSNRGVPNFSGEPVEFSFTVENNVSKYGTFKSTRTYDTITNEAQALKTATFWSIRDSNSYRYVNIAATMEHADLEVFDCVTLNISGFPSVKAEVREVKVDPETGLVDMKLWTPILSGTNEAYYFAWPANIPAGIPYPTNNIDLEAPEIEMTPPSTSPLYIADLDSPAAPTTGDRFPSDLSDTLPENICYETSDADIISVIEPEFDEIDLRDAAESADNTAIQNYSENVNVSGGSFDNDDDLEEEDDPTEGDICKFEVVYQYATATSIAEGAGSGFDCDILPGPCKTMGTGARCGGPTVFRSKFFGNEDAALAAVSVANSLIEASYCSWTTGKFDIVSVSGPYLRNGSDCTTVGGIVSVGSND